MAFSRSAATARRVAPLQRRPATPTIADVFARGVTITAMVLVLVLSASRNGIVTADDGLLQIPSIVVGDPQPGCRASVVIPEYADTEVHHLLYLPPDWSPEKVAEGTRWPVIVEYTGSRHPSSGSTGQLEDAAFGLGLSGGRFIWVVLPFVSQDHQRNETHWWGDRTATVDYAKRTVPRVCAGFGGDPESVFLCGFSRGAIAVNLIGLHDDEIAKLWCGFVCHDHYDGVCEWRNTDWGSPLRYYRASARRRLGRVRGRPVLITSNGYSRQIRDFLDTQPLARGFQLLDVDTAAIVAGTPSLKVCHPHTDRWLLVDSPARAATWRWVAGVRTRSGNAPPSVTAHSAANRPSANWSP